MRHTSFAVLLLLITACGDDPAFDSGVPGNRPLSELSSSDGERFCISFSDYLFEIFSAQRVTRMSCTLGGIAAETISGVAGQCEVARDACIEEQMDESPGLDIGDCDGAQIASEFVGCDATVSELEHCLSDLGASLKSLMNSVSCSLADDPERAEAIDDELEDMFATERQPASCAELNRKCPEFNIFE